MSAPTCQTFTPGNLTGMSLENQIYLTNHCIPSRIFFGTYVFYFIVCLAGFLLYGVLFIRGLIHSRKMSLKQKIFLLSNLSFLLKSVWIGFFLFGLDTRVRYLIQSLASSLFMVEGTEVLSEWFSTITRIEVFSNPDSHAKIYSHFKFSFLVLNCIFIFGSTLVSGLIPVILYPNVLSVNWTIAAGNFLVAFASLLFCLQILQISKRFEDLIPPGFEDAGILAVKEKFKRFNVVFKQISLNVSAIGIVIPIWMGISTHYNVGMYYFYYLFFYVIFPSEIALTGLLHWMGLKIKDKPSPLQTKSSRNSNCVDESTKKFPSYSVEELKGP